MKVKDEDKRCADEEEEEEQEQEEQEGGEKVDKGARVAS